MSYSISTKYPVITITDRLYHSSYSGSEHMQNPDLSYVEEDRTDYQDYSRKVLIDELTDILNSDDLHLT